MESIEALKSTIHTIPDSGQLCAPEHYRSQEEYRFSKQDRSQDQYRSQYQPSAKNPSTNTELKDRGATGYFIEEVYHDHSHETDYWLGEYGSDRRYWIGSDENKTLEQAMDRAREIIRRL